MWDILLVFARLLQFAGALVLLGSSLFCIYGLRALDQPWPTTNSRPWQRRIVSLSALAGIVGTVLWIMSETVLFSGESADGTDPAAVWLVFSETRFGRVCLLRVGLLIISLLATGLIVHQKVLMIVQAILAIAIITTFAWTGHGAMTAGWLGVLHLGGDVVHLWAAGVWFGALPPIAILIWRAHRSGLHDDVR
ncbi:MAG: hypothetical protein ABIR16_08280 [Dokdonella sp.]